MKKIEEIEQRVIELEKKLAFLLDDGKRKKIPTIKEKKLISLLVELSNGSQKASIQEITEKYGQIGNQEIGYMLKGLGFKTTKKNTGSWIDLTNSRNKRILKELL